jgi:hypothetical protein
MRRCSAEHIAQQSMSRATLEATGRQHWVIIHPVSPWQTPWSSIFLCKKMSYGVVKQLFEASVKMHKTDSLLSSSKQQAA